MPTITLEAIKTEQTRLAKMIAELESQASRSVSLPETTIHLAIGERYAGILLAKDGEPSHHLIMLPGEAESHTWADAQVWATEAGGGLPTRCEQALLYANLKDQFQPEWYWACELHSNERYAWAQDFYDGGQDYGGVDGELRARAVRRLEIL